MKGIFFRASVLRALALTRCPAVSSPFLSPVDSHKIIGLVKYFSNLYLQELLTRWRISKIVLAIAIFYSGKKVKGLSSGSALPFPLWNHWLRSGPETHFHSSHNQLVSKVPSLEFLMCARSSSSCIYEYFYNGMFFLEKSHHLWSLRIFNT